MKGANVGERLALALLHYPVYNRNRDIVTTAVTNLDLHDIARASRTYGVGRYYVVTPIPEQRELANRVISHWREGWGAAYNTRRKEALELVSVAATLDEAVAAEAARSAKQPRVVVTGARGGPDAVGYDEFRRLLQETDDNFLLLFGTGWGLAEELAATSDYRLAPISGAGSYNHLSVRSAVSIILDRLLGR